MRIVVTPEVERIVEEYKGRDITIRRALVEFIRAGNNQFRVTDLARLIGVTRCHIYDGINDLKNSGRIKINMIDNRKTFEVVE